MATYISQRPSSQRFLWVTRRIKMLLAALALTTFSFPAHALIINYAVTGVPLVGPAAWTGTIGIGNLTDSISGVLPSLISATINSSTTSFVPTAYSGNLSHGGWADAGATSSLDISSLSLAPVLTNQTWNDLLITNSGTYNYTDTIYGVGGTSQSWIQNGTVTFTQGAAVPGPLPVLGAVAAFAWSRRLRQRIRAARGASV